MSQKVEDTRNKFQKLFDTKYGKKESVKVIEPPKRLQRKPAIIVKVRKRKPKHVHWLPESIAKDEKVHQALKRIDADKREAISNFKYI